MDGSAMFDLNRKIERWRLSLLRVGSFQWDELNELETHLRDAFDQLLESGISSEEAFSIATRQIGDPVAVSMEYQKSRGFVYRMARSPVVVISVVTLSHFLLHVTAVLFSFGASMKYFESGEEPTASVQILNTIETILAFPLVLLIQQLPTGGTGHWGTLIFLANSFLWGLAAWIFLARIRKRSSRRQYVASFSPQATDMP